MPPVPKKPMFFMFSSTFPWIAKSADLPRLRFNHIRDLCSQKMCFFHSKNHTLANLPEYQKNESACGPRKGPCFCHFLSIGPVSKFMISEERIMMTFLCLDTVPKKFLDYPPYF